PPKADGVPPEARVSPPEADDVPSEARVPPPEVDGIPPAARVPPPEVDGIPRAARRFHWRCQRQRKPAQAGARKGAPSLLEAGAFGWLAVFGTGGHERLDPCGGR